MIIRRREETHHEHWNGHLDHRRGSRRMLPDHASKSNPGMDQARAHAKGPEVALLGAQGEKKRELS